MKQYVLVATFYYCFIFNYSINYTKDMPINKSNVNNKKKHKHNNNFKTINNINIKTLID